MRRLAKVKILMKCHTMLNLKIDFCSFDNGFISFYEKIKIHAKSEENPMAKDKPHGVYQMT